MIWCIEDDDSIRDIEVYALRSTGFEARGFADGASFREALKTETPELILLDIMLPGEDGVSLLRHIKSEPLAKGVPVIMATAKGMEYDKVQSLDLGADDYIVKPFGMMEMISRVKAVLRRCEAAADDEPALISVGGVTVNDAQRTVTVDGGQIALTFKEFELLKLLASRPGIVFTRDRLFSEIWGMDFVGETRTVDMHIRTLRRKLGRHGGMIVTVRGVGYRLDGEK